jgi:hypothetical protein
MTWAGKQLPVTKLCTETQQYTIAVCSTYAPNSAYFIVTRVIIIIICSQKGHKTSRDCTVITHCHVRTRTMTSPHSKHTCTHLTSKMSQSCSTRLHSYNVFSVVKISYLVFHLLCWVGKINQASCLCLKQPPKTMHDTHLRLSLFAR